LAYVTSRKAPVATSWTKPPTASLCGTNGFARSARPADVPVKVGEHLEREQGCEARLRPDGRLHLVIAEGQHAAVGVVDEHDLPGPERPLGDQQRADRVIPDDAGVSSPSLRIPLTLRRASMQASTATRFAGGIGRAPRLKARA